MTDYPLAGPGALSALTTSPAAGILVPVLNPADVSTAPADSHGSDQTMTLGQVASFANGTLTQKATVYVATTGNDGNDGLSWQTAFATISHAISALPTVGGIQMGTVEVGFGTFTVTSGGSPAITVTNTQAVHIRGRGLAQGYTPGIITSPQYLTKIADTGTGTTIQITGILDASVFSTVEGLALSTTTAADGIVILNGASQSVHDVSIDGYSDFGLYLDPFLGGVFDSIYVTRCGATGASTPTGGVGGTGILYQFSFRNCQFLNCKGFGAYFPGGRAISFYNTVFQATTASSAAHSGSGFYGGGSVTDGYYNFQDCWFEANALYGAQLAGAVARFTDCVFAGNSTQVAGIVNGAFGVIVEGCYFLQHTGTYSIVSTGGNVTYLPCVSQDTAFINGISGVVPSAQTSASTFGVVGGTMAGCQYPQALSVNGAVTFYPGFANIQVITLTANATSSTIDTASNGYPGIPGQLMTICWIQGAGGSHTYAWPAVCKFAAGTAPAASTTAGFTDSVTFYYNGTNWLETARAVGVH